MNTTRGLSSCRALRQQRSIHNLPLSRSIALLSFHSSAFSSQSRPPFSLSSPLSVSLLRMPVPKTKCTACTKSVCKCGGCVRFNSTKAAASEAVDAEVVEEESEENEETAELEEQEDEEDLKDPEFLSYESQESLVADLQAIAQKLGINPDNLTEDLEVKYRFLDECIEQMELDIPSRKLGSIATVQDVAQYYWDEKTQIDRELEEINDAPELPSNLEIFEHIRDVPIEERVRVGTKQKYYSGRNVKQDWNTFKKRKTDLFD